MLELLPVLALRHSAAARKVILMEYLCFPHSLFLNCLEANAAIRNAWSFKEGLLKDYRVLQIWENIACKQKFLQKKFYENFPSNTIGRRLERLE